MTREQEIAEGLKRGELLAKLECGCVIIQDRTADAYVVYCSKHNATPPSVFKAAWNELAKCFGERMQQDELDLMDSVLQGVELDMEVEIQQFTERQIGRFPHLASREADKEES